MAHSEVNALHGCTAEIWCSIYTRRKLGHRECRTEVDMATTGNPVCNSHVPLH